MKYWILRMRFMRKLRTYVQNTIDNNIASKCQFCDYRFGLFVELIPSLEDMFFDFLDSVDGPCDCEPQCKINTVENFNYQAWMAYFKDNAVYRTACMDCIETIGD